MITLIVMLIKKYVLGLQDPMIPSKYKYTSLLHASSELIIVVTLDRVYSTVISFWCSGKKGVMDKKSGMAPTRINSRGQKRNSKEQTTV